MKRVEFLEALKARLWALPEADIQCSLDYYSEMIDDRMEDGLTEEEAVAAIGNLEEIVQQILGETPRPPVSADFGKPCVDLTGRIGGRHGSECLCEPLDCGDCAVRRVSCAGSFLGRLHCRQFLYGRRHHRRDRGLGCGAGVRRSGDPAPAAGQSGG